MNGLMITGYILAVGLILLGVIRLWMYLFGRNVYKKCYRCRGRGFAGFDPVGSGHREIVCGACNGRKIQSVHIPGKLR